MTQGIFDKKVLHAFIVGFGVGVNDLQCEIHTMRMTGSVDTPTHYYRRSIPIDHNSVMSNSACTPGKIHIPDVHKVGAFLKACDDDRVHIRQIGNMLSLQCGDNQFSTPTSDYIMSAQTIDRADVAIKEAKKNMWTKLGRAELQVHGTFEMDDARGLDSMTKVAGKDAPVRIHLKDDEMTITAGSRRGARMSREVFVDTPDGTDCETVFGPHIPKLLNLMPAGPTALHMGDKSALVFSNNETDALLILKHQEGVDQ